ncbi:hypothetical protein DL96DRAFT_1623112 [Flagelloscypha sp. PMI_526]|nr:hypothetical protein DL96DRAFT_1623112 [Flagelloscypha sp. PMI_526]
MATFKDHTPPFFRLPPELFEHIMSFIVDRFTLKACCLTSKLFKSAQAKLFSHFMLRQDGFRSKTLPLVIASPHLIRHIRSITAYYRDPGLPTLLDAISSPRENSSVQKAQLRGLTLVGISYSDQHSFVQNLWPTLLSRSLHSGILPFLTYLDLQDVHVPIPIVAACTSLQHLRVSECVFNANSWTEQGKILSMPSLKSLGFDATQNYVKQQFEPCPFINLVLEGDFPALRCLDLYPDSDSIHKDNFPVWDIERVMTPLMNRLVCLDIGFWSYWDDVTLEEARDKDKRTGLDFFLIQFYPNLRFFSTCLGDIRDLQQDERFYLRLEWLLGCFEKLDAPHPLEALVLRHSQNFMREYPFVAEGDIVDKMVENAYGGLLKKVIITVPSGPEFATTRNFLEKKFRRLCARGMLSFEPIDMEVYLE